MSIPLIQKILSLLWERIRQRRMMVWISRFRAMRMRRLRARSGLALTATGSHSLPTRSILFRSKAKDTRLGAFCFWWRRGESFSPAGSVRVGSDCHRQSFTTNTFDSLQIKSKRHPLGCLLLLVEAGGIEPPSENLLIQLSPGGVYLQIFPYQSADRQALCTGSRFVCDLLNGIREVHIYH